MRHKNSISQVNLERDKEMRKVYVKAKGLAGSPATIDRICQIAANLPTTKFYVSDYWALRYIKNRLRGTTKYFRDKRKQTLYNALYDNFKMLQHRHKNKDVETLVDMALEQPAPFLGLSPGTIRRYIRQRLGIKQYS